MGNNTRSLLADSVEQNPQYIGKQCPCLTRNNDANMLRRWDGDYK